MSCRACADDACLGLLCRTQYGYARVTAVNATYLDWEWVCTSSCGAGFYDGQVLDHMVITQRDPATYSSWVLPTGGGDPDGCPPLTGVAVPLS